MRSKFFFSLALFSCIHTFSSSSSTNVTNSAPKRSIQPDLNNSCPSCQSNDVIRNFTINEVKNQILKNLGMQNGPPSLFRRNIDNNLVNKVFSIPQNTHSTAPKSQKQEWINENDDSNSNIILSELRK